MIFKVFQSFINCLTPNLRTLIWIDKSSKIGESSITFNVDNIVKRDNQKDLILQVYPRISNKKKFNCIDIFVYG